jgi:hypothetical protein
MIIRTTAWTAALAAALSLEAGAVGAQPTHLALDHEAKIAGVDVACTGIGQTKDDPRWLAYPVRVEFAGAGGEYLANETLTLFDAKGAQRLAVSCEGPWILLKLPPGKAYKVDGKVGHTGEVTVSAPVKAPSHGQARVVLTFPSGGRATE